MKFGWIYLWINKQSLVLVFGGNFPIKSLFSIVLLVIWLQNERGIIERDNSNT